MAHTFARCENGHLQEHAYLALHLPNAVERVTKAELMREAEAYNAALKMLPVPIAPEVQVMGLRRTLSLQLLVNGRVHVLWRLGWPRKYVRYLDWVQGELRPTPYQRAFAFLCCWRRSVHDRTLLGGLPRDIVRVLFYKLLACVW